MPKPRGGPGSMALRVCLSAVVLLASLNLAAAEVYPDEYAGYLDGGERLPCLQYFVLRQEAQQCVELNSSVASLRGEVCSTVAGPLLAVYSPEADRSLFTARIIGPQVQMLPLMGCAVTEKEETCDTTDPEHTSAIYALMSGLIPGMYKLEVQWLYTGFSYGKDRIVINNGDLQVMNAMLRIRNMSTGATVGASSVPGAHPHATCVYCSAHVDTWPVCSAPYTEGTWLAQPDSAPALPSELIQRHDPAALRWQPLGCRFKPLADMNLSECLERDNKHICFVGDSQTRHMFNGFVDAVDTPGGSTFEAEEGAQGMNSTTDKSVHLSEFATHISMKYGEGWVDTQLDPCTHVIFNFGQWPLSHQPASRWSASHFARVLRSLLLEIRKYRTRRPDTRFYWASINSHALGRMHLDCESPTLDYRTQPFTDLFNAVATMMMKSNDIPVINTGLLTSHLYDLSYDGAHYHWAGSVGHCITEYVANVLCVQ